MLGTWMQRVAQAWLFYELTGSAAMLGLLAIIQQGPILLAAPFAGTLADRLDRRRILVATQAISSVLAMILAILAFTGLVESWHVMALAFGLGLVNAADTPARQALVEELVGRKDLPNAIALNSATVNGARLLGPAIAGAAIAAVGVGICFLVNSMTYLAVIGALLAMRLPRWRRPPSIGRSLFLDMRAGFAFIARDRQAALLLGLLSLVALAGMPYSVLLPAYAHRALAGGAEVYGILMGSAGAGALVGALILVGRTSAPKLSQILLSALIFGGGLIGLSLAGSAAGAMLTLFTVGAGLITITASTNTVLQIGVPAELRGRVMALYGAIVLGLPPLGGLAFGASADAMGEAMTLRIGGVIVIAVGVGAWLLASRLGLATSSAGEPLSVEDRARPAA